MSAPRAQLAEVEVGVVDPLAVEGDERVGDRALAARDQHLLVAVGVQQHQVVAGVDVGRVGDLRPGRRPLLAVACDEPRRADVDDVVVELDRRVGRERLGHGVELRRRQGRVGGEEDGGERDAQRREEETVGHGGPLERKRRGTARSMRQTRAQSVVARRGRRLGGSGWLMEPRGRASRWSVWPPVRGRLHYRFAKPTPLLLPSSTTIPCAKLSCPPASSPFS